MNANRREWFGQTRALADVLLRALARTFRYLRPSAFICRFKSLIRVHWRSFAVSLLLLATSAHAGPKEDARADGLYREVRCVVCQSESISDSDAEIAADMRRDIRAGIASGKSDEAIRQDLYARYGDYVLFRPRISKANLVLWAVPPLIAVIGIGAMIAIYRRRREAVAADLTEEEAARLRDLMNKPD